MDDLSNAVSRAGFLDGINESPQEVSGDATVNASTTNVVKAEADAVT